MKFYWLIFLFGVAGNTAFSQHFKKENNRYVLTTEGASHLASLPLKCIEQTFPYKRPWSLDAGQVIKKIP